MPRPIKTPPHLKYPDLNAFKVERRALLRLFGLSGAAALTAACDPLSFMGSSGEPPPKMAGDVAPSKPAKVEPLQIMGGVVAEIEPPQKDGGGGAPTAQPTSQPASLPVRPTAGEAMPPKHPLPAAPIPGKAKAPVTEVPDAAPKPAKPHPKRKHGKGKKIPRPRAGVKVEVIPPGLFE